MNGRKRGGQPGNLNALKHGFYSRNFKPSETEALEAASLEGLHSEIVLLRVMIRRVVEAATNQEAEGSEADENPLEGSITALDTLGTAATRLANLLKAERKLVGDPSASPEALNKALGVVIAEYRGKNV